jgi:hypothetical protein
MLVTVVAMIVAMMVVMAGTASAQPTFTGAHCISVSGREGTLLIVTTPSGEQLICIKKTN